MGSFLELNCLNQGQIEVPDYEIIQYKSCKRPKPRTSVVTNTNNLETQQSTNRTQSTYIKNIITIQKNMRGFFSRKIFNKNIETLLNIYILDSNVNLIRDPLKAEQLLLTNKGEVLSRELLKKGVIEPFDKNKAKRESKYIINTELTYVDKYKNNDLYVGQLTLEKKFTGYGILYSRNCKFEGYWDNNKLNGKGRFFLSNGDYFEGTLHNNMALFKGIYIHKDETIYEGEWMNNHPDGEGKETLPDGSSFVGIFCDGNKVEGTFKWENGSYYIGKLKNNVFEGEGIFHWNDGKEYKGTWKNGQMEGKGILIYPDGSKYEGDFLNGKKNGYGTFIWNQNKIFEGYWYRGKQHGNGVYKKNGVSIKGAWINGKLVNTKRNSNDILTEQKRLN